MEEILEGEQVLAGMFSLNGHPAIVLFDSSATGDFISKACNQKYQLTIQHISTPYMISIPGGKIVTKQMVMHTPLNLAGKIYKPSMIVLDGQWIDVILGMSLVETHKTVLDITARVVRQDLPVHDVATLQLSLPSAAPPSVHHTTAQKLEEILLVCEFPDVFPDDLPGMLPYRDVEFTIELQPGMAPISRWPYKMTPKELAELKV
jgi:hypothetical protein